MENSWNWNNFVFRKINWLYNVQLEWGMLVQCCSNERSSSPPISGAVSGAVASFLSGLVDLSVPGVLHSKHQLAAPFLFLPALGCNLKQVIAFNPGKINLYCFLHPLQSPFSFPTPAQLIPFINLANKTSGLFRHEPWAGFIGSSEILGTLQEASLSCGSRSGYCWYELGPSLGKA